MTWELVETRCAVCGQPSCRCKLATRREPCACGATVAARLGSERDAVARHNATPKHRAWRKRWDLA